MGQERVKLKLWPCINPTYRLVGNLGEETEILRKQTAVGAGAFTLKCYELSKALFLCYVPRLSGTALFRTWLRETLEI